MPESLSAVAVTKNRNDEVFKPSKLPPSASQEMRLIHSYMDRYIVEAVKVRQELDSIVLKREQLFLQVQCVVLMAKEARELRKGIWTHETAA